MSDQPAVIFVNPEHSGNIGSLARIMKNVGLSDLRIAGDVPDLAQARKMAVHGIDVLESARTFPDLESASADKTWLVALTAKPTETFEPMFLDETTTEDLWGPEPDNDTSKTAIILGGESNGLTLKDRGLCSRLVKLPVSEEYRAMNIAMAAGIYLFHAWMLGKKRKSRISRDDSGTTNRTSHTPAIDDIQVPTVNEREMVLGRWFRLLEKTTFFKYPDKEKVKQRFRRLFSQWRKGDMLFFCEAIYQIQSALDDHFKKRDFLKEKQDV